MPTLSLSINVICSVGGCWVLKCFCEWIITHKLYFPVPKWKDNNMSISHLSGILTVEIYIYIYVIGIKLSLENSWY